MDLEDKKKWNEAVARKLFGWVGAQSFRNLTGSNEGMCPENATFDDLGNPTGGTWPYFLKREDGGLIVFGLGRARGIGNWIDFTTWDGAGLILSKLGLDYDPVAFLKAHTDIMRVLKEHIDK